MLEPPHRECASSLEMHHVVQVILSFLHMHSTCVCMCTWTGHAASASSFHTKREGGRLHVVCILSAF